MEIWQILAIVLGAAFIIMFVAWIVSTVLRKQQERKNMAAIEKMYADSNLFEIDYHSAANVEEELLIAHARRNGGQTYAFENAEQLTIYGVSDLENLEEITGNYKP